MLTSHFDINFFDNWKQQVASQKEKLQQIQKLKHLPTIFRLLIGQIFSICNVL